MTTPPFIRPQRRSSAHLLTIPFAFLFSVTPGIHGQTVSALTKTSLTGMSYSDKASPANLPDAPSALLPVVQAGDVSSSVLLGGDVDWVEGVQNQKGEPSDKKQQKTDYVDVDANGKPIPVDRHQTHRIGGIIPNYRAVSGGAVAHPPGWKYNFKVATHQAFDYSGFIFLFITSISAEGLDEHKSFGKGIGGLYTYTWHGFLDKTDGTYIQAWFLPSLLHEDTRYYAMGNQHRAAKRILYVLSRQVVARTYGGHDTPNIAGFGGKVLTQVISRTYYPASSAGFSTLAEKFSFSVARDIGFTALREFYPDYLGYQARKRERKAGALAALDKAAVDASVQSQGTPAATKPDTTKQPPQ